MLGMAGGGHSATGARRAAGVASGLARAGEDGRRPVAESRGGGTATGTQGHQRWWWWEARWPWCWGARSSSAQVRGEPERERGHAVLLLVDRGTGRVKRTLGDAH